MKVNVRGRLLKIMALIAKRLARTLSTGTAEKKGKGCTSPPLSPSPFFPLKKLIMGILLPFPTIL